MTPNISSQVIVQAAPLGGGSPVLLGTTFPGVLPYGLAVSSTTAYFAGYSDYYADGYGGNLFAMPLGGGTPSIVWCGNPFDVVVDKVNVYWTDQTGLLLSMPLAGGSVTTMFSGAMSPANLAVDSKNVYFTDWTGNAIYEVPIGGKGKVLVETHAPYGIAADDPTTTSISRARTRSSSIRSERAGTSAGSFRQGVTRAPSGGDPSSLSSMAPPSLIAKSSRDFGAPREMVHADTMSRPMMLQTDSVRRTRHRWWSWVLSVAGWRPSSLQHPAGSARRAPRRHLPHGRNGRGRIRHYRSWARTLRLGLRDWERDGVLSTRQGR